MLALDVNTRMTTGFYLSLEPPSLMAVALCLSQGERRSVAERQD